MNEELLIEEATVIESSGGYAKVEIIRNENCEHCSAKLMCNSGKDDLKTIKVKDPFGSFAGDRVRISVKGKTLAAYSILLYGIPLLILIAGIFFGLEIFRHSFSPEFLAFSASLGIIFVYYSIFLKLNKTSNSISEPEIISIKESFIQTIR